MHERLNRNRATAQYYLAKCVLRVPFRRYGFGPRPADLRAKIKKAQPKDTNPLELQL